MNMKDVIEFAKKILERADYYEIEDTDIDVTGEYTVNGKKYGVYEV